MSQPTPLGDLGMTIDMQDATFLRLFSDEYALGLNAAEHERLLGLADAIEQAVRDIGALRQQLANVMRADELASALKKALDADTYAAVLAQCRDALIQPPSPGGGQDTTKVDDL